MASINEMLGMQLGNAARAQQEALAAQVFNDGLSKLYQHQQYSTGFELGLMGQHPGMSHVGTVRDFRRKFKQYTKAEFREISNKPLVKDILSGMTKLNKEQTAERIKEHLEAMA